MRARLVLLIGCCLLVLGYGSDVPARAAEGTGNARHIAELTNSDRTAHGLPALRWDGSLAAAAQAHAERMAAEGYLSHQYPGEAELGARAEKAGAHFREIAENIATGYGDAQVEQEWMHSAPHRRNILDPGLNAIGVAVVARGNILYVAEDFADASESLSSEQVEHRVGGLLRQEGVEPSVARSAAAATCASRAYPPGARLVMRFDTGDLSHLPAQVAAQIHKGDYRKASVAACPGGKQGNFTTYMVAIVLY
jgi:hypothetical protein